MATGLAHLLLPVYRVGSLTDRPAGHLHRWRHLGAALVQRGWHVVLDDIQDVKAKQEAERLTRAGPGSAESAGVDVCDADGVADQPDELVLAHWDTIIDTNLRGVIHGCHAAYPLVKQHGSGTILNTPRLSHTASQRVVLVWTPPVYRPESRPSRGKRTTHQEPRRSGESPGAPRSHAEPVLEERRAPDRAPTASMAQTPGSAPTPT